MLHLALALVAKSSLRTLNMPTKAPLVSIDPQAVAYGSPDEAAAAISTGFIDPKNKSAPERIAVILKRPDGQYVPSTVAVSDSGHSSQLRVAVPKGHALAGLVHSHPGDDDTSLQFSDDDLNVADQLKVPSYVRFAKDDNIRKYVPGESKTFKVTGNDARGGIQYQRASTGDPLSLPSDQDGVVRRDSLVNNHDITP